MFYKKTDGNIIPNVFFGEKKIDSFENSLIHWNEVL